MQCDFCGQAKADVSERVDPFALEVNDEMRFVPMCDDCEQNLTSEEF